MVEGGGSFPVGALICLLVTKFILYPVSVLLNIVGIEFLNVVRTVSRSGENGDIRLAYDTAWTRR